MPRYKGTVTSPHPREDVFEYLANFASVAEWDPSVTEAAALDADVPRLGARYRVVVSTLGRESAFEYETITFERPSLVVLRAETGTVVSLDTIAFAATPFGGTEVTYDADLRLKGPLRLAELPMRAAFRHLAENARAGLDRELRGERALAGTRS